MAVLEKKKGNVFDERYFNTYLINQKSYLYLLLLMLEFCCYFLIKYRMKIISKIITKLSKPLQYGFGSFNYN